MSAALPVGIAAGYGADLLFGDPARGHPVAGLGRVAVAVERACYRDGRVAGTVAAAVVVGVPTVLAAAADRRARRRGWTRGAYVAAVTWAALGGRSLAAEARAVAALVDTGDLRTARRRVRALVSRDPVTLDAKGLARAAVESVAENTSDAVVAPLLWAVVAGPAGVVAHRAANTLDAMVGYRTDRYLRFGWAAARLDDALNLAPARLTALLTAVLAPTAGGSPTRTLAVTRRDGGRHPSPNAGRAEAAFAGALDVRLGDDEISYHGEAVRRPPLGDGPPPSTADVERAVRLSIRVGVAAAALATLAAGLQRAGR